MLGWLTRYKSERMLKIWSEEEKFNIWKEIEVAILEAWAKLGVVPSSVPEALKKVSISPDEVRKEEEKTRHEVTAFVNTLSKKVSPDVFEEEQMGSSIMPHKRNPVVSENLTGIARIIRSAVVPALENIALFMERDISHSSVERVILPQICILLDYALVRLRTLLEGIQINESKIKANLEMSKNLILSSRALFELVLAGVPRDKAYKIIQKVSFDVIEGKAPPDFRTALISYLEKEDKKLASIISEKLSFVKPAYISHIFSRTKNMPFEIKVKKKPEVFDPEGKAIKDKLEKLGYRIEDVRVGKVFEIRAQNGSKDMIENFFINPIVEFYEMSLKE